MQGEIIDTRLANALFKDARMAASAGDAIGKVAGQLGDGARIGLKTAQATLDSFAEHYGGLWVGGKATLRRDALMFDPNALNRLVHENGAALRLDLPLAEIDAVATRFGWFTGIIDVTARGAVFSLRCYGSKAFARKIDAARAGRSG